MFACVAGAFRKTRPQVRVLGTFRQVHNVFVRVDGRWRPAWSYSWDVGGWGGCSVSCGGGTQTRTVRCLRSDGVEMPDTFCSQLGAKPATSQSCNTQPCYTYRWATDTWGSCNASCGYGTRYRTVWCRRNDGASADTSYCAGYSKPATSESCYAGSCVTYSWYSEAYGSCQAGCGSSSQKRTVYCKGSDGNTYADSKCKGTKPATTQNCTSCIGCAFDQTTYLNNKAKQCTNIKLYGITYWTPSLVAQYLERDGFTAWTHWQKHGINEGICPWNNKTCCINSGYDYY